MNLYEITAAVKYQCFETVFGPSHWTMTDPKPRYETQQSATFHQITASPLNNEAPTDVEAGGSFGGSVWGNKHSRVLTSHLLNPHLRKDETRKWVGYHFWPRLLLPALMGPVPFSFDRNWKTTICN